MILFEQNEAFFIRVKYSHLAVCLHLIQPHWDPYYKQFMQCYAMARALRHRFQRRNFKGVALNF